MHLNLTRWAITWQCRSVSTSTVWVLCARSIGDRGAQVAACARRRAASASSPSATASESRAQPAPWAPNSSPGATPTRALGDQPRRGHALGQRPPDEERTLRGGRRCARGRQRVDQQVAPRPVDRAAGGDVSLVGAQGRGKPALDAGPDASGDVVHQRLDPAMRVAEPTAKPTRQPAIPIRSWRPTRARSRRRVRHRPPGSSARAARRRPGIRRPCR